jgi:hypothetical protein
MMKANRLGCKKERMLAAALDAFGGVNSKSRRAVSELEHYYGMVKKLIMYMTSR